MGGGEQVWALGEGRGRRARRGAEGRGEGLEGGGRGEAGDLGREWRGKVVSLLSKRGRTAGGGGGALSWERRAGGLCKVPRRSGVLGTLVWCRGLPALPCPGEGFSLGR